MGGATPRAVKRRPLDAVQQGSFNDAAEVVIGSAKNDGSVFGLALPLLSDKLGWPETMLRGLVDRIFGPPAGKAILRQFPRKGFARARTRGVESFHNLLLDLGIFFRNF